MYIFLILSIVVILVLAIMALCISANNSSKLNSLINYSDDADLVKDVAKYYRRVRDLESRISLKTDEALIARVERLERLGAVSYSKSAIVTFDAFDDVTGSLSFAVTLLNENLDGFMLTSLYGHNSNNTYIRIIKNGSTATKLLSEEIECLNKAKESQGGTLK